MTEEWGKLPRLSWKELLQLFIGQRARFQVTGRSMLPLLQPGDEVIVNRKAYQDQPPEPGDVALAWHPYQPTQKIIKLVAAVESDRCLLIGQNSAESTDSRSFGWVSRDLLIGKVTCQFRVGNG